MTATSFRVLGRVQGVGFRAYAVRVGESLGLVGEVWNTRDGAVEGVAQGESVGRFLDLLAQGPGFVQSVSSQECSAVEEVAFRIGPTR